jgi:hypothetical protein
MWIIILKLEVSFNWKKYFKYSSLVKIKRCETRNWALVIKQEFFRCLALRITSMRVWLLIKFRTLQKAKLINVFCKSCRHAAWNYQKEVKTQHLMPSFVKFPLCAFSFATYQYQRTPLPSAPWQAIIFILYTCYKRPSRWARLEKSIYYLTWQIYVVGQRCEFTK